MNKIEKITLVLFITAVVSLYSSIIMDEIPAAIASFIFAVCSAIMFITEE